MVFVQYCYVRLLWSNSIWKQYNTDHTLALGDIKTKRFSWVGEENEGKKGIKFCLFVWKGGRVTLWPLTRIATASILVLSWPKSKLTCHLHIDWHVSFRTSLNFITSSLLLTNISRLVFCAQDFCCGLLSFNSAVTTLWSLGRV